MSPITMWILRKGLEFVAFEVPFKQWQAEFIANEKKKLEEKNVPPSLPPVTGLLIALVSSFMSFGASCNPPQWVPQPGDLPYMKIYCCDAVQGHPERCSEAMKKVLCEKTPEPRVTPTPVPSASPARVTPTATPTASPTALPTATPTATPLPTVEPCGAAPAAPRDPVSILFPGPCPRGFDKIDVESPMSGNSVCVAKSTCPLDGHRACDVLGIAGDRAAWSFWYNVNQGQTIQQFNGKWLLYDAGRGCKDAYGRFFHENQGCTVLYTHPTDPDAEWTYNAIAKAAECPTPGPIPTPIPPVGGTCKLPRGTGDGIDCPRISSRLLGDVTNAVDNTMQKHPEWLEHDKQGNIIVPEIVVAGRENDFREVVVDELRRAGLCAFFDTEEIAVKNTNAFSEQYAVVSSSRNVRRGEGSYRATCVPAWKDIPVAFVGGVKIPPLESQQNVGDHCQNSLTGNRFLIRHECDIDSTGIYRDPSRPADNQHDQPCDPDHEPAWSTFCYFDRWLDPRGPIRTVTNAVSWSVSDSNPNMTVVVFEPGREFTVCTRPQDEGWPTPVIRPAEQCHTMRYPQ